MSEEEPRLIDESVFRLRLLESIRRSTAISVQEAATLIDDACLWMRPYMQALKEQGDE